MPKSRVFVQALIKFQEGGMIKKFHLSLYQSYISLLFFIPIILIYQICFSQGKIMPLGNSITMGISSNYPYTGYRDDLYNLLINDGLNFDFVGSLQNGDPFQFDVDHEGHSGCRAQDINANINVWLNDSSPNVVLLHIGTNDISANESNQDNINEIESIINKIYNYNSQTTILLCSIIPRKDDKNNKTIELNVLINQLVNQKIGEGYNIYYVDQYSAFTSNGNWQNEYMSDYLHPNDDGYYLMAVTFFNVLANIFNPACYTISGNVLYYANNNPINNVIVNLSGGYASSFNTELNGFYEFNNLSGNKNYLVQPEKDKLYRNENQIITMYNAALTLRHAVGIDTLSSNSQIAADVDIDGQVIAFDAALIARYVVELAHLGNDHVGEWVFSPAVRNYQNLVSNQQEQNFTGILLGDVDGAWKQAPLHKVKKSKFKWLSNINAKPEELISIPISIFEDSLLSLDVEIEYPSDMLEFVSIEDASPGENRELFFNVDKNKIKAGAYFANYLSVNGEFFNINFKTKEEPDNDTGIVSINRLQINNYSIEKGIAELNISQVAHNQYAIKVADNYPNPFNPTTIIPYEITRTGNVTIRIYNMLGQHVKILLNEEQYPGVYKAIWDGRDNAGMGVANGIYVYRVSFKDQVITKTMLKLE